MCNVIWGHVVLLLEVIANGRSLVLFNSLVKMSARIADIPCITQVTLRVIHNALLIHERWLVFPDFDLILDFPTLVRGADVYIDLPAEVSLGLAVVNRRMIVRIGWVPSIL